MDRLTRQPSKPPEAPPPADGNENPGNLPVDPAPAAEAPAADPAAAPDPAAEAPEPGADADPAPAADSEPSPDPEETDTGEVTAVTADRLRLRLNKDDEVGRLAAAFKLRNKDWSLKDCIAAAEKKLGVAPTPETPAAEQQPPKVANPDLPQTIEAVDSTLSQLETKREEALANMDFIEVGKIDKQLRRLDRQRTDLERQVERQQATQAATYETAFTASESRAAELYPGAADPQSAFGKRMIEVEKSLQELDDPLYYDPNKPLKVAQMVAAEMNIAPRRPGARTPAPAQPAAPPPKGTPKTMVPSGASRSAPAPAVQPVVERIAKVQTVGALRELQRSLGIKDF